MKLVIEDEAGTRSIVPFTGDVIVVGRGADDVTFRLADRNVSRRHARFLRQNGNIFVEDLGSLTGTRVNGERIAGRRKLRAGDLVQIGDYDLAILAEGVALEPGAPPPLPAPPLPAAPLPAPPRTDPDATALTLPTVEAPTPPMPSPAAAEPAPRSNATRVLGRALAAGVLALALGLAAGWVVGAYVTRP